IDLGGTTIRPLHPLDENNRVAPDYGFSENDNSLVLKVCYRGRALLLAGDVEADAERALVARSRTDLRADILKVPHHGSPTSSTVEFVAAVHPQLAVFSVGEHNRWNFPNPTVVARYRLLGTRCMRTDRDGGVTATITKRGRIEIAATR